MKITTMRLMDKWLGVPVCLFLTIHRKLFEQLSSGPKSEVQRILFVKLAEQGATVLAYPALQKAVDMAGKENVFFLVFEENRFILDAMGIIPKENVISLYTTNKFLFFFKVLGAIRRMRKLKLDAAIDFEFFARSSAALSYLSGARRRVGFHSFFGEASYRGDLMTHRLSFNPHLHTSQSFYLMVEALNVEAENLPAFSLERPNLESDTLRFQPQLPEIAEVTKTLCQEMKQETPAPLILLNANAGDLLPLRRWPEERYIELARRLLQKFPEIFVGFTGAPEEKAAAEQLVHKVGSERCLSLAGKTTLQQLLVLYSLADVLVTNDSGPAHFAALTPIDVIVLFGPETPALFAAQTPRTHVLWSGIVCSPCVNAYNDRRSSCRNNLCMQKITVDQVFEEVCMVYEKRMTTRIRQTAPYSSSSSIGPEQ